MTTFWDHCWITATWMLDDLVHSLSVSWCRMGPAKALVFAQPISFVRKQTYTNRRIHSSILVDVCTVRVHMQTVQCPNGGDYSQKQLLFWVILIPSASKQFCFFTPGALLHVASVGEPWTQSFGNLGLTSRQTCCLDQLAKLWTCLWGCPKF